MSYGDDDYIDFSGGKQPNPGTGGNVTQSGAGGINLETGQPIQNPSLGQMSTGQFQMTANGPQWLSTAPGVQAPAAGGGSTSDNFFAQANAPMQQKVVSMGQNPNNPQLAQYHSMMQQLMGSQAAGASGLQQQYQAMLAKLTGSGGLTDQLADATKNYGAQQQGLLDIQHQNQTGGLAQNLISRGLGNTSIQNTMQQGLNRNQTLENQNLQSNIAQQKMASIPTSANIQQQAYNANPAQGQQGQYLNLISRLGSAG